MVKYPEDGNLVAPSITGGQVSGQTLFIPWQPGTWPRAPQRYGSGLRTTLSQIFHGSMVDELRNVNKRHSGSKPRWGTLWCTVDMS